MTIIRAELTHPDKVSLDVTITATLAEWKALHRVIKSLDDASTPEVDREIHGEQYGGLKEPFWSIVHRLDSVLDAVERQHTNYEANR